MQESVVLKHKNLIIIILLLAFSLAALYIRIIPMFIVGDTDIINFVGGDDPIYNIRQTEVLIKNFPTYPWFEAMTLMPYGTYPHWGSLFIYILATASMLFGATALPEIISISLLIPPIMSALLVPIAYILVKKLSDSFSGILAALFMACVSGQYFARGIYGYVDHHIAEVLFGTLFILAYVIAIQETRGISINFRNVTSLKKPILWGCVTGIAYTIGLLTMPTMILFAFIISIFMFVQPIIDHKHNQPLEYLFIINTLTFLVTICLYYILGFPIVDFTALAHYSPTHPIVYGMLIFINSIIYLTIKNIKTINKKLDEFISPIVVLAGVIFITFVILYKYIYDILYKSFFGFVIEFFGQTTTISTVQEARAWASIDAWNAYNFSLILMIFGFTVLAYRIYNTHKSEFTLVYIWSIVMLISTVQHIRYEYYLSINIAILSAIGVGYIIKETYQGFLKEFSFVKTKLSDKNSIVPQKELKNESKKQKRKNTKKETSTRYVAGSLILIVTVILTILFVTTSSATNYNVASSKVIRINPDWKESLDWLGENSPDPGVDYYKIYDGQTFKYPEEAYGVMSWWDYGHLITVLSHRIPNANPFQQGVAGNYSSSSFFMAESEDTANEILDNLKTKYIVTDIEMATGKYWAMATWYNPEKGITPYMKTFVVPNQNPLQKGQMAMTYTENFYKTMITRLHILDGTAYKNPDVVYIEYTTNTQPPTITFANQMNYTAATEKIRSNPISKTSEIISPEITSSIGTIDALTHYRLIHESPTTTITNKANIDVKYVKIFEYVPGATLYGDGTIKKQITTNTGRTFVYTQHSKNGKFILPYEGVYILNENEVITVTENEIQEGLTIQK
jgi:dolichyl-diphosphooligosaccharide--protein glycosyltransferase